MKIITGDDVKILALDQRWEVKFFGRDKSDLKAKLVVWGDQEPKVERKNKVFFLLDGDRVGYAYETRDIPTCARLDQALDNNYGSLDIYRYHFIWFEVTV